FCTRGEPQRASRPHRACLGGAKAWGQERDGEPPCWYRSPRPTELISVGAKRGGRTDALVQKPPLHRGKPGGGAPRLSSEEPTHAQPGNPGWGGAWDESWAGGACRGIHTLSLLAPSVGVPAARAGRPDELQQHG